MSHTYLVIPALLFAFGVCESKAVEGTTYPIVPLSLLYLGQINGKQFWFEDTTLGNWTDARNVCANFGMILAEVKTNDEVDFLDASARPGYFQGFYWVGGRDAQTPNQFLWDNSEEKCNSTLNFGQYTDPLTCLYISIFHDKPGTFHSFACSTKFLFNPLCQSV